MTSLPSKKLQAIVSVRNKHFKSRTDLKPQGWKQEGHQGAAEGKEKKILRRDIGQILGLEATTILPIISTSFLLLALPMFKVNHQQVPQFTGQDIWHSLRAHGYVQFFLIHSPKVAIPFLTFTSLK